MEAERKCLLKEEEEPEPEEREEEEEEEEDDEDSMKKRISSHPLFGLLVETHLNCLRVGGMGEIERNVRIDLKMENNKSCLGRLNQPELDGFMEAYCFALGKLKEAMEEPQLKSMAFINKMKSQLRELTPPPSSSLDEPTTTSSGKNI